MPTPLRQPVPAQPYSLQIEITSHCNLSCVMCPLTTEQTASGITKGHIGDLVWDEVKALARTAERIVVAGFGEPLVNRRALPLLAELEAIGVPFSMVTNAHALSPDTARQLVALRWLYHINISIDSPDPEIYAEVRGGPLDRALRGIRNLMAAGPDPARITVSSVMMEQTLPSLVAMPALLAELGVRTYMIQGLFNCNDDDPEDSLVSQAALARYIPELKAACDAHGITLIPQQGERLELELADPDAALEAFYRPGQSRERARQCVLPWEQPYVDKDGLVYPCCFAASKDKAVLGDLRSASLSEIWLSPRYDGFRTAMLDGATTPGVCRECLYAPLGEHPLRRYAARLVPELSQLFGERVRVVFQNTGEATWTAANRVFVGAAGPRTRSSRYATLGWANASRPASFTQREVPPGGYASFEFPLNPDPAAGEERFQLVVEGVCWLPGTDFAVSFDAPDPYGPVIRRPEVAELVGSAGWRPTDGAPNGAVVARLSPSSRGGLPVRPPIIFVDTEGRRYAPGEVAPAGAACTVWFDRPVER